MILKLLIPVLLLASATTAPRAHIQCEGSEEPTTSIVSSVPESEESELPTDIEDKELPTESELPTEGEAVEEKESIKDILSQWFSPQTVTAIISIITALAAVLKLASSLKDLAKKNQLTIKNVTDAVKDQLPHEVQEVLTPYLENIEARENEIRKVLEAFAKVLALSQENTPEARLAILEAIEQLGVLQNGITGDAKRIIEKQKADEDKKKEEIAEEVGKVIESTDDGTSI